MSQNQAKIPVEIVIDPQGAIAGSRNMELSQGISKKLHPAMFTQHHAHPHFNSTPRLQIPITFRIPGTGYGPPYF